MEFLRKAFLNYYERAPDSLRPPPSIGSREFGFQFFDREGMVRHLRFLDYESLRNYVMREAPAHAFFSSAYYERPDEPIMGGKGWLGADLIFDIDADHIPTPCKERHDSWTCLDCGAAGRGQAPEDCPSCRSKRLEAKTWLCESCLGVAKEETVKLIEEFLLQDLGMSMKDVMVKFSGHRGYHVHVESKDVRGLDQDARREVTDYIKATGLKLEHYGLLAKRGRARGRAIAGPSLKEPGWRGRLANGLYSYLRKASAEELKGALPLKKGRSAGFLLEKREEILRSLEGKEAQWNFVKDVDQGLWRGILSEVVRGEAVHIDERVTTDTSRLIRLPGSLHGKSGLKAMIVGFNELERFNPLKDAVAFTKGSVILRVKEAPQLTIGDVEVGPLKNVITEVPMAPAVYLLCKGAATLVE